MPQNITSCSEVRSQAAERIANHTITQDVVAKCGVGYAATSLQSEIMLCLVSKLQDMAAYPNMLDDGHANAIFSQTTVVVGTSSLVQMPQSKTLE
jgi:hypothetical protein